jgi:hypothetical protein
VALAVPDPLVSAAPAASAVTISDPAVSSGSGGAALEADEVDALFEGAKKKAVEAAGPISKAVKRDYLRGIAETSTKFTACYPHNPPSQVAARCYQGEDMATMMHTQVPQFQNIINYPYNRKKGDKDQRCIMCGKSCSTTRPRGQTVSIPNQNKGVCTACDTIVWIHAASGLQIKWCKGCKNFKTWASFGHKGHRTKCMRCRDDQNKRYARQKAEKTVTARHTGGGRTKSKRKKSHVASPSRKKSKAKFERDLDKKNIVCSYM